MVILQGAKSKIEMLHLKQNFLQLQFEILPITEAISHRAAILAEEHTPFTGPRTSDALVIATTVCEHQLTLCSTKKKTLQNIAALDFQPFIPETAPNA